MRTPFILIAGFAFTITSLSCRSAAQIANTAPASKPSTSVTKLQFPQPWQDERESFLRIPQIEVRKIPNSSGSEFFFRGLPDGNMYSHEDIKPRYGPNVFAVKFDNGIRVRTATHQEWESGSRIPTEPRLVFPQEFGKTSREIDYRQKRYSKAGKYWGSSSLSPTGRWLAVFSHSGEKPLFDFQLFGGGEPREGDIFWQIYDTVTGEKVFEWEAKNAKRPTSLDNPVVWLEDRYFLFSDDEATRTFNVVTLPAFTPEVNPVTLQLPSRKDPTGRPLPAGASDEVWIPLIPLTKEQVVKLTARSETEISEVRLSPPVGATELLIAINEETENRRVNRASGDGAGDYHFRLISTYYFAVNLDNPTQTRVASKEEWDRGRRLTSGRSKVAERPVGETVKSSFPPYRQFAKTGTTWGSPPMVNAGTWIAVFSHSGEVNAGGRMFVDVYDQRLGDKLLSTDLPFTVPPDELFRRALSVEGGFVLLPLNTSLDSFALWRLPD